MLALQRVNILSHHRRLVAPESVWLLKRAMQRVSRLYLQTFQRIRLPAALLHSTVLLKTAMQNVSGLFLRIPEWI